MGKAFGTNSFLAQNTIQDLPPEDLSSIIEKSNKFPINTTRINVLKNKIDRKILKEGINSAYPVIHERALLLFANFLNNQRRFGQFRNFYQNMTLLELVDRILTKRAVSFFGPKDEYLLIDGKKGNGGWEKIGTSEESVPLVLENYLSYYELKLSSLLGVSSYSNFVNDGNRNNQGKEEENKDKVQENGIVVGLIGARLEKEFVMEFREVMTTKTQNQYFNGYGNSFVPTLQGLFCGFFGSPDEKYFEISVYKQRMAITIDVLLMEASARAKNVNKLAYVYVTALGLEDWKITPEQDNLFLETFLERIEFLSKSLANISNLYFSRFNQTNIGKYKNGDIIPIPNHPGGGITVNFGKREPFEKLTGLESDGKLLVVSYDWNSNSLPGNEFWLNNLSASSGSAVASSSQIAEIQNPHINSKISANNLRVVTQEGLFTFQEYRLAHLNDD